MGVKSEWARAGGRVSSAEQWRTLKFCLLRSIRVGVAIVDSNVELCAEEEE